MSWLLLLIGLVSLAATANARRPRTSLLFVGLSWLAAWVTVELATHIVVVGGAAVVLLAVAGALESVVGWIGLAVWVLAVALVVPDILSAARTTVSVDGETEELDLEGAPRVPWYFSVFPFLAPWRRGVRHERGVLYGEADGRRLKLDIFRPAAPSDRPRPAVVHVHGGAWLLGSRTEQGLPLLNHLAANGWVGFNIDYRLSPQATLPEHVEDVKRSIAWVREHAEELGVDPNFIALTGGSAGGHLTALAALTAGDPSLQPGFEESDTSVQAAVPFYGVYDFLDEAAHHHPQLRNVVEWIVVKARLDRDPERFRRVSPLHRIHAGAPPFLVVHGTGDTLVPVAEGRTFADRLREVSDAPVLYAEMRGAQHAFDVLPTIRTTRLLRAIERFLTTAYEERRTPDGATERELTDELASR